MFSVSQQHQYEKVFTFHVGEQKKTEIVLYVFCPMKILHYFIFTKSLNAFLFSYFMSLFIFGMTLSEVHM